MTTQTKHYRARAATSGLALVAVAALFGVSACDELDVPDFNNPGLESLEENPTAAAVITTTQGMFIGSRNGIGAANSYVSLLGILGRESYNFDDADPRFISEMLINPLNAGSPAFGGNLWTQRYINIRTGNVVLNAVGDIPDADLSAEEKEGIRGFVKTLQALDFLLIINTRDENGAVIDVNTDITAEPGPIVSKDAVFDHIETLLGEARDHLDDAGGAFAFAVADGYEGFETPARFVEFNRALAARVALYREDYDGALTALAESFIDETASFDLGVYWEFGTGSGDTPNGIAASADIFAHPELLDDAETKPGGELDDRVQAKLESIPLQTQFGVSTDVGFLMYPLQTSPIPIIRNEELILIRAEARLMTGDLPGAASDVNLIRTQSGGLASIPDLEDQSEDVILDEILQQRRYSLLFEGGHRWIDLRRTGNLDRLPLAAPDHTVHEQFPIPRAECLAQTNPPPSVCPGQ